MKIKSCGAIVFLLAAACAAPARAEIPRETQNAALRYWLAFAEMKDPPADKAIQELLEKTVTGESPWDEKKLGAILDANGEAIRIMQRATKLPDCDWGLEYGEGPRASIAYAPRARVLARLNTLEGMREMANGNSGAAVETWLAGIRFSRHLANGGPLVFALIARSMLLPNFYALSVEIKRGHLSDVQKRQISSVLKEMPEDCFNWATAWGLEASAGAQFLRELEISKNPAKNYESLAGFPLPKGAKPPSAEDIRGYSEYTSAVRNALSLPPTGAKIKLAALEAQRRGLSEIAQNTIPNPLKINDARAEVFGARKELLEGLSAK
ncbi:MAG TPA: hypothetical protein VFI38_09440 [Candidatus Acidoferrum sp.]|nr:hypothetical protein [Candidatus Acidoferrum sp.]